MQCSQYIRKCKKETVFNLSKYNCCGHLAAYSNDATPQPSPDTQCHSGSGIWRKIEVAVEKALWVTGRLSYSGIINMSVHGHSCPRWDLPMSVATFLCYWTYILDRGFCLKIKSWFISLKTRFSTSISITLGVKGTHLHANKCDFCPIGNKDHLNTIWLSGVP